jgi:hypothetical protein
MGRLAGRTSRRVPVSAEEASWIYDQATARAAGRRLDAWIDTGRPPDPAAVVVAERGLDRCAGLWFFSLDAARLEPVLVARSTYALPYMWSEMAVERQWSLVRYRSRRR